MTGENDDWLIHQAHQGVPRVGQSDPITYAGAMKKFALLQRAQKGFAGFGLFGQLRDLIDEFIEHGIPVGARQIQVYSRRGKQLADGRMRFFHGGILDTARSA
jgi:hypothetical protein